MTRELAFDDLKFSCPFCGREVHFVDDASKHVEELPGQPLPRSLKGAQTVLHMLPMCRKFRRMDANQFLAACKRAFAKGSPS